MGFQFVGEEFAGETNETNLDWRQSFQFRYRNDVRAEPEKVIFVGSFDDSLICHGLGYPQTGYQRGRFDEDLLDAVVFVCGVGCLRTRLAVFSFSCVLV